ncbi:MAG: hypothetical protein HYR64_05575 [Fimbriimonas ginsengisoli]|uniref:Uncharacterized protein n=1 Tax=Fimbriimonas ginsengisoli TaxID=1005039 RepID=A0A931LSK8_FIMGI|nr:hypothetical protein [Fimbriimonas ginsengisoli]
MTAIPSDIDRMLWNLTDSRNAQAIADFEGRYPEWKAELDRRLQMLDQLRGARDLATVAIPSGPFIPTVTIPRPNMRVSWTFGALGLAAIAGASFFATRSLLDGPAPSVPLAPAATPQEYPTGNTYIGHRYGAERESAAVPPRGRAGDGADFGGPVPLKALPKAPPGAEPPLPMRKRPMTIHVVSASMQSVLEAISSHALLDLFIAPGTPNPDIRVDYIDMSPMAILQDMGKRFGFTALEEGSDTVLIVPAIDGGGPTPSQPASDPANR